MKIFVRTLGGSSSFGIEVKPEDMVADVKKTIETTKGADTYPAVQQMLFHQGKVLKDGTTLEENKVAENNFVVIMLTKNKGSAGEGPTMSSAPSLKAPLSSAPPTASTSVATGPLPAVVPAPAPIPASIAVPDIYDQASSNLVAGDNLEVAFQQILDMGGGTWDRDTVVRALHAAYNNPESAVEYLYSGIPEWAEAPPTSRSMSSRQAANMRAQPQQPAEPTPFRSAGPNANPLNLFPQGQQAGAIPQATTVTPEDRESIEKIEAMGFNRTLVLEAFFACNKNEELAANYLLDHIHEFQE